MFPESDPSTSTYLEARTRENTDNTTVTVAMSGWEAASACMELYTAQHLP